MQHTTKKKMAPVYKWMAFTVLMFLLLLVQVTPGFFKFGTVTLCVLVILPAMTALFEPPFESAIFGGICGLLWDASASVPFGFFGFFTLILCFCISFFAKKYLRINYLTALLVGTVAVGGTMCMNYVFLYLLWGYSGMPQLFVKSVVPTVLFSALLFLPLYFLVKRIEEKLTPAER